MPDAEKIIARKIDKILRRNGFGGDYTQAELDGWGSEIASALRDAEVLTETEWEYTGKIGDTRRYRRSRSSKAVGQAGRLQHPSSHEGCASRPVGARGRRTDVIEDVAGYWSRELQADVEIYEAGGVWSARVDGISLVESRSLEKIESELARYYVVSGGL